MQQQLFIKLVVKLQAQSAWATTTKAHKPHQHHPRTAPTETWPHFRPSRHRRGTNNRGQRTKRPNLNATEEGFRTTGKRKTGERKRESAVAAAAKRYWLAESVAPDWLRTRNGARPPHLAHLSPARSAVTRTPLQKVRGGSKWGVLWEIVEELRRNMLCTQASFGVSLMYRKSVRWIVVVRLGHRKNPHPKSSFCIKRLNSVLIPMFCFYNHWH